MTSRESQAVNDLYRQWLAIPAQHADWSADDQERLVEDTWINSDLPVFDTYEVGKFEETQAPS